jgi:hypothetical protein
MHWRFPAQHWLTHTRTHLPSLCLQGAATAAAAAAALAASKQLGLEHPFEDPPDAHLPLRATTAAVASHLRATVPPVVLLFFNVSQPSRVMLVLLQADAAQRAP